MRNRIKNIVLNSLRRRSIFACCLCLFWLCFSFQNSLLAHDFYVAICKIKFDEEKQNVTVKIRIFSNDFERAIATHGGTSPRLGSENEHPESAKWIDAYIQDKFSLEINEQAATLQFVKYQNDMDATECFFRVDSVQSIQKLAVRNEILVDLIEAHTNIIRIHANGQKKFFNLNYKIRDGSIEF